MSILVECRTVGPRRFSSTNVFCVFASTQRMTHIMKPTILSLRFGICTSLLSGVISSLSFCGMLTKSSARICATSELGYKVRTSRTGTTRTCTRENLADVTLLPTTDKPLIFRRLVSTSIHFSVSKTNLRCPAAAQIYQRAVCGTVALSVITC